MQYPTEAELLEKIESFCERHDNMAPTRFGRDATGNPHVIRDIREGRSPSLRTVRRLIDFMAERDAEQMAADGDLAKAADAARRVA
jgi:hypothetical protein